MVTGPFLMWRKNLKDVCGMFDEQLVSGADFDLSIRLCAAMKVMALNEILGAYLDEGKGASTRPDTKQPLERTVIELRYGIYDKIDPRFLEEAKQKYDVQNLSWHEKKIDVSTTIIDFLEFTENNRAD
jgi:hypothetical protein